MTSPVAAFPGEEVELGHPQVGQLFVRRVSGAARKAEPAVFVHGLGGASTNWTDLMHLLRGRLAGAAVDLPGFGHSPPPRDGDYRLDAHVRAVCRFIERDGRGPVHLFGNSLGGAVSTRLAALRPDLVRSLTLVSPALPDRRPRLSSARLPLLLMPGLGRVVGRRIARQTPERRTHEVLALCYADPSRVHPIRVNEAVEETRRRLALPHAAAAFEGSLRGLAAVFLERGPGTLWRQAAGITAPTLLIYGGRDRLVDARLAPRAARVFRDSRLLLLPDSGHVAQLEHPEIVARAVLDMLDGLPS